MKVFIFIGVFGLIEIVCKNWEYFVVGAVILGIIFVCGENVCGVDLEFEFILDGKVKKFFEMDRRINIYKRFYEGWGEILV